eukprot:4826059-Pleurochrysis_carterae.AAC.3
MQRRDVSCTAPPDDDDLDPLGNEHWPDGYSNSYGHATSCGQSDRGVRSMMQAARGTRRLGHICAAPSRSNSAWALRAL